MHVKNECQELGLPVTIEGTASSADAAYGDVGVFDVVLAGFGDACPGPNYIVQGKFLLLLLSPSSWGEGIDSGRNMGKEPLADLSFSFFLWAEYVEDDYAIVQSPDFSTLFILSREQNVTDDKLTVSSVPFVLQILTIE